jgi:hypothetical protein
MLMVPLLLPTLLPDHSSGLVSWAHQRSLASGNKQSSRVLSKVYCPIDSVDALECVFAAAQVFREKRPFGVKVCGLSVGEQFGPVAGSLHVRPFATTHRISSLGFTVFHQSKKLKACYQVG